MIKITNCNIKTCQDKQYCYTESGDICVLLIPNKNLIHEGIIDSLDIVFLSITIKKKFDITIKFNNNTYATYHLRPRRQSIRRSLEKFRPFQWSRV